MPLPRDGFAYRRAGVDLPLLGLSSALTETGPALLEALAQGTE